MNWGMLLGRWFKGRVSNKADRSSKDVEGRCTIICIDSLEDRLSFVYAIPAIASTVREL
jgi:hypothetical protein